MSIIVCCDCSRHVDTDLDDYHCDESGEYCLTCREAYELQCASSAVPHISQEDAIALIREAGRGDLLGKFL